MTVSQIFQAADFGCVIDGQLVPVVHVLQILHDEQDPSRVEQLIKDMAVIVHNETGKNDIILLYKWCG